MKAREFERRVAAVFQAITGAPSAYGSKAWFARKARTTDVSVSRWINGTHKVPGTAEAVLEQMEARVEGILLARYMELGRHTDVDRIMASMRDDRLAEEEALDRLRNLGE